MFKAREATQYLYEKYGIKISPYTMAQWRCQGKGPEYFKLPGSSICWYTSQALDMFVNAATEFKPNAVEQKQEANYG